MKSFLQKFPLLALLLALSTASFAQTQIGFKLGLQKSGITSDLQIGTYTPAKMINSAALGVVMEVPIGQNFAFQPELGYTNRGFKVQEGFGLDLVNIPLDVGVKLVTKIHQINIPLLAKYKFGNEKVKAYVMAGPEMGYAVGGNFKTQAHLLIDITLLNEKLNLSKTGIQRFELGATAGGGVAFNTGAGELFFDARYYRGFSELVDLPIVELPVRNKGFQFNIGYMFPIGG